MKYGLSPIRTPDKYKNGINNRNHNEHINKSSRRNKNNILRKATRKAAATSNFLSPDFSLVQAFLYDDQVEEDSDDEYDVQRLYELSRKRQDKEPYPNNKNRSNKRNDASFLNRRRDDANDDGDNDNNNPYIYPEPSTFNIQTNQEDVEDDNKNPEDIAINKEIQLNNNNQVFEDMKLAYTKLYNEMKDVDGIMDSIKPCAVELGYNNEKSHNRRVIVNHRSVYLSENKLHKKNRREKRWKNKLNSLYNGEEDLDGIHDDEDDNPKKKSSNKDDDDNGEEEEEEEMEKKERSKLTLVARKSGIRNLRKILPITQLQVGMHTVKKVPLDVEIVDSHDKYGPHFLFTVAYDTDMEEKDVVKAFKPATATLVIVIVTYIYLVLVWNWAFVFLFPPIVVAGVIWFHGVSPFSPMEGIAQFRVEIKDITGWNHRSLLTDHAEVSLETKLITRLWRTDLTIPIPETPRPSIISNDDVTTAIENRKKSRTRIKENIDNLGKLKEETEKELLEEDDGESEDDQNDKMNNNEVNKLIQFDTTINPDIVKDLLEMSGKHDGLRKRKGGDKNGIAGVSKKKNNNNQCRTMPSSSSSKTTTTTILSSRTSRTSSTFDLTKAKDAIKEKYEHQVLKFRYTEPLIHPLLKDFVKHNEELIPLVEDGMPSWSMFLAGYGFYYRKWMRSTFNTVVWIASVGMMILAFYDLFQNVPMVRRYAKNLLGRWFGWLDSVMSAFRLMFLPLFVSLTPVIRGLQGIFNGMVLMLKPMFTFFYTLCKGCYSLIRSLCSCCKSAKDVARLGSSIGQAGSKVPSTSFVRLIYRTCKWMWNIFRSIFIVGLGKMGSYLTSHTESIYRLYFIKHKELIVKVLIGIFLFVVLLSVML